MKILFYQYESIFELPVMEFLKKNGIEIDVIHNTFENKGTMSGKTVERVYKYIQKSFEFGQPYLFVFSINFFPAISEICQKMNVVYVCWSVDDPVLELFTKSITNLCNRIFLFDKAQYERFSKYNPKRIFYLPLGGMPEKMQDVVNSISENEKKLFSHDISFVGSLYSQSSPLRNIKSLSEYTKGYIDGIVSAQMNVYGYNFMEQLIPDAVVEELKAGPIDHNPEVLVECIDYYTTAQFYLARYLAELERKKTLSFLAESFNVDLYTSSEEKSLGKVCIHPPVASYGSVPKIYHCSKINLNISLRSIQSGLPLRIFDVLSSGGFLITNYQSEIEDFFEIGRDLEVYSSLAELKEKCAYYLLHEEERKAIAENGYRKLCAFHTCDKRMEEMIRIILESF